MSLSVGNFYCKTCEITFKGEYKPQQRPRKSCPKCHKMVDMALTAKNKIIKKAESIPPQNAHQKFIDDPNELLLSVAIRELNKPNPDSRWATILISCKKEKITTKSEVLDQFKQLPTRALVNLLSKLSQEEY